MSWSTSSSSPSAAWLSLAWRSSMAAKAAPCWMMAMALLEISRAFSMASLTWSLMGPCGNMSTQEPWNVITALSHAWRSCAEEVHAAHRRLHAALAQAVVVAGAVHHHVGHRAEHDGEQHDHGGDDQLGAPRPIVVVVRRHCRPRELASAGHDVDGRCGGARRLLRSMDGWMDATTMTAHQFYIFLMRKNERIQR
ncbi:Os03g0398900 [Oryza sativa Japonica Group]|uniref:Os03g0398900 protein n=2 Tax=Oryza sativa subsp. japonica TaxID=39947 RepID=Q0DRB9_ORYSJ|nr:hypothetical protein EE612_017912 [Oryza sativa]BAF12219.1 Os03g0398900 [Oryza sativa Japonica Group]BAS84584.1 Os03g0398900 [Oryza sativa Japonica Group]|eukprot:NP_001050305.1 Os03g0398900 [Oryza sativa Japonica Group]